MSTLPSQLLETRKGEEKKYSPAFGLNSADLEYFFKNDDTDCLLTIFGNIGEEFIAMNKLKEIFLYKGDIEMFFNGQQDDPKKALLSLISFLKCFEEKYPSEVLFIYNRDLKPSEASTKTLKRG